jgi:hypothetical protein
MPAPESELTATPDDAAVSLRSVSSATALALTPGTEIRPKGARE